VRDAQHLTARHIEQHRQVAHFALSSKYKSTRRVCYTPSTDVDLQIPEAVLHDMCLFRSALWIDTKSSDGDRWLWFDPYMTVFFDERRDT